MLHRWRSSIRQWMICSSTYDWSYDNDDINSHIKANFMKTSPFLGPKPLLSGVDLRTVETLNQNNDICRFQTLAFIDCLSTGEIYLREGYIFIFIYLSVARCRLSGAPAPPKTRAPFPASNQKPPGHCEINPGCNSLLLVANSQWEAVPDQFLHFKANSMALRWTTLPSESRWLYSRSHHLRLGFHLDMWKTPYPYTYIDEYVSR